MKNIVVCIALIASQIAMAARGRRVEAVAIVPDAGRAEDVSARTSEGAARETRASTVPEIVKVKGVGTGETEETALKDAYRDAVESAVGMYVDAEQAAKNDEVIKDEILTQSNAYIEDYDEIEKKKENGLVKIKILARVKRQEITKRISGTMKAKSYKVGGGLKNLHAQMTTTEKKSGDGAALLAQALEGVDPLRQLMEVSLATGEAVQVKERQQGTRTDASDDNMVTLAYLFKFEINRDRYFKEFLPNLERVLTQVSEVEPKGIVLDAKAFGLQNHESRDLENYQKHDGNMLAKFTRGIVVGKKTFHSSSCGEISPRGGWRESGKGEPLDVVLVTECNSSMTSVRAKQFKLDAVAADAVRDFEYGADAKRSQAANGLRKPKKSRSPRWADVPVYTVTFADADGKALVSQEITIASHGGATRDFVDCSDIVKPDLLRADDRQGTDRLWFVTPFIGCCGSAYYQWCSFKIAKDDLPKIDSIKIELAK